MEILELKRYSNQKGNPVVSLNSRVEGQRERERETLGDFCAEHVTIAGLSPRKMEGGSLPHYCLVKIEV